MKRIVSVLFVTVMCCVMIVGCGGKDDVTKLPHNSKISITDKKSDILEKEELDTEDNISYVLSEPGKIDGKEYSVTYQFSNTESEMDLISSVYYDSEEATLDDAKKYIEDVYGELDKDSTEGKYGPGQDGRYIIKSDGKVWTIGYFTMDNGDTRIIISRDASLE
ncbi:hypothetical protein [[Clostridium] scindens]|uniref:Lipoprotein n=1 Tax=Clostridium scindens (strain ATCC 35704 / DSM 5676 / VPI 13733 / 19) TaxID=411468 RepID=A0A494WLH4_CLOS5|nr:hypothetical protein [[Clostridium] scindens]QBF72956.1 hypothetical protein HDCHBGLK_00301 [[Clostridium] scindens ATCC 35704]QRO36320.1 hypothetical protein I6J57_13785 [[Clostridium] scindens]